MDLLDELRERIVPGDGAMGTYLMELGVPLERCFEELCLARPDLILRVHREYLAAGARVIETNSFGANAARLARHGLEGRVRELNLAAVSLARQSLGLHSAYVAGSVGPLGLSSEQLLAGEIDRAALFREQISALLEGGVDLLFLETFLDFDEIALALAEAKLAAVDCPVICSLACTADGNLPSGLPLAEAFRLLRELGAEIVGVNCANGPQAMLRLFEHLPEIEMLSAYPNAGYPKYHEGRFLYFTSPDYFARSAVELAALGARLIGGCCGTGPEHIAAAAHALAAVTPGRSRPVVVAEPAPPPAPAKAEPPERPTLLEQVAAGKKVILTELDPPKTLELEKFYAGARALTEAGSDFITLADNSLAILRVSNLALAAELKLRHDIEPLLHLSCRDRNVLGLQSELLGMAALGMRHVLPLTGDPAKVGDHPGATSVYDLTSIELIRLIAQLNQGLNANGKPLRRNTGLVIGCTFTPGARNVQAQLSRLDRKLAAGAQYVMTQPIFDPELVRETARRTAACGVPVFVGVWPLLSGRQAEFLHHEVPGIAIPDSVREAMRGLEGAEGRRKGVALAQEICRAVLDHFPGVYLITPFLAYETTVELARFVRAQ